MISLQAQNIFTQTLAKACLFRLALFVPSEPSSTNVKMHQCVSSYSMTAMQSQNRHDGTHHDIEILVYFFFFFLHVSSGFHLLHVTVPHGATCHGVPHLMAECYQYNI